MSSSRFSALNAIEFRHLVSTYVVRRGGWWEGGLEPQRASDLLRRKIQADFFFGQRLASWLRYERTGLGLYDDPRVLEILLQEVESSRIVVIELKEPQKKYPQLERHEPPAISPGRYDRPGPAPTPAPAPDPDAIHDDPRSLFIVRCDPELRDEQELRFEYLIRGLHGQPSRLIIRSSSFPGEVVHARDLSEIETQDAVHSASWDGIVTIPGPHCGARLSPVFSPCQVEIVHDNTYCDEAPFSIPRSVAVIALDGFFHTASAVFLPSRPARGGPVETRDFPVELLNEWREGSELESIPFLDQPFEPPDLDERRDTVGLLLLTKILDECGAAHSTRRLLLAGHANSAGADAYNDELSAARAQCVWSTLCGDAEGFTAATDKFHAIEDHYVLLRYCAQRFFWPCDPGDPRGTVSSRYREAVRNFQRDYNEYFAGALEVDGKVGPQTRKAFFAIYESVLRDAFGGEGELAAHRDRLRANIHGPSEFLGCGERYSASREPRVRGLDDRRVEALLFLPDDPVPDSPADIYETANYRFTRWTAPIVPEIEGSGYESSVEEQSEEREPTPLKPLPSYQPYDPDDPWDFLNAFRGAVNQALRWLSSGE
ncbi:MAG: hypothetical protein R6X02_29910 [Enhygromyxa sp.]